MANNNYGYVLNKSQIQSQLLNRGAYKSALSQLGRQASTEVGQAFQQYADTIEAAYVTSSQNKNFVSASPMFSGYKRELESDIDTQLDQIYKQASAAYQQNLSTIAEQYAKGASEVVSDATKQTDLANKYWQAHLDYYNKYLREELLNSNLAGVALTDMIERAKFGDVSPYENYIQNWFTEDEEGSRMKTVDELLTNMTERDAEGNLVFNEDTVKFLQMLEDVDTDDILRRSIGSEYKSFSDWLRENNYDVYEWAASDQGVGFGSGFNLFRELADMPENTQFRSYQSFTEMPENKQKRFIDENKDNLLKTLEVSESVQKDVDKLWSNIFYANQKNSDYITVPEGYQSEIYDYYREYFDKHPTKLSDLDKDSIKKLKDEVAKYSIKNNIENLAKQLYGSDYSESDIEFLKKELGL